MSRFLIFAFLVLTPILFMVLVNESRPAISHERVSDQCSRYCHDHPCPHADLSPTQQKLYVANISWLKKNPFGLSYQVINLLIYVLLLPLLILFFLWTFLRKPHGSSPE